MLRTGLSADSPISPRFLLPLLAAATAGALPACSGRSVSAEEPDAETGVLCNLRCVWHIGPIDGAALFAMERRGTRELIGLAEESFYRVTEDGEPVLLPITLDEDSSAAVHPLGGAVGVHRRGSDRYDIHAPDGSLRISVPLEPAPEGQYDEVSMAADDEHLIVHRVILDLEHYLPMELRIVDHAGNLLASFTDQDQMNGSLRVGRDPTSYYLSRYPSTLYRRRISDGSEIWRIDGTISSRVSDSGDDAVTESFIDGAAAVANYSGGVLLGDPLTTGSAVWNVAISGTGRYSAANTQSDLFVFERGLHILSMTPGCKYIPVLSVSDQGDAVFSCHDESANSKVILTAPDGACVAETGTGIDDGGWSPWPEFVFDDETFFVRYVNGLALLTITGRDPSRALCPPVDELCDP